MINGLNLFDQPIRNDLITYGTGQADINITGCLLDYNYFTKTITRI